MLQAGANRVVSPYTMAGRRIAELALRPRVVEFIDAALSHGELAFSMEEVEVGAGGPLDGRTVGALRAEGITLAVVRGPGAYDPNPPDERLLTVGETLIVSGSAETLRRLREAPRRRDRACRRGPRNPRATWRSMFRTSSPTCPRRVSVSIAPPNPARLPPSVRPTE